MGKRLEEVPRTGVVIFANAADEERVRDREEPYVLHWLVPPGEAYICDLGRFPFTGERDR